MEKPFETIKIFESFIRKNQIPMQEIYKSELEKTFGNYLNIADLNIPVYVSANDQTGLCSFSAVVTDKIEIKNKNEILDKINLLNNTDLLFKFTLVNDESVQLLYSCPIILEDGSEQILNFVLNVLTMCLENCIQEIIKTAEA